VLGRWYVTYRKLMAHWEQVLPLPIHTVRYEDLVQDPEPTIRGLVDFVGLPWDDACLSPHKNDRVVATASRNQVQQPIHKKWIGRSASYREHLEPLVQALGPWAP